MNKLKVIGITSGVGSLQYGFKQAGWDVEHAHEWRQYYNTGTFERNFGKEYRTDYAVDRKFVGIDCLVSHPECGLYSNLYTGKNRDTRQVDPGDIFKFIDLAKLYKPGFFLVDNLPKSLLAVPQTEWKKMFRNYNLQFEMISNWGYGNVQKNRNRMFIIGSHKDHKDFKFMPGERKHDLLLNDVIWDIKKKTPNHNKMQLTDMTQWSSHQIGLGNKDRYRLSLKQFQPWLHQNREKGNMMYYNLSGEQKHRPGYSVVNREKHAPVLTGGGGAYDNHWIYDVDDHYYRPLTIRERLRIQGFGDDFIVTPTEFQYGTKDHQMAIKQTGKCMPVQFPEFFANQVKEYINNGTLPEEATRVIKGLDQIMLNVK